MSRILYCRCAFAQVVPQETKDAVLQNLCDSGASFESVSDLCEMAARKDARLEELIDGEEPVKIVACYPRAVKWLFHNAGISLPESKDSTEGEDESGVEVLNMREQSADEITSRLLESC